MIVFNKVCALSRQNFFYIPLENSTKKNAVPVNKREDKLMISLNPHMSLGFFKENSTVKVQWKWSERKHFAK